MNDAMLVHEVIADDGCKLTLRQLNQGNPEAVPVIFIHALAMNGEMWNGVAQALDASASLYALDCRGHGSSDKPAGPYTTARFARDLLAVLEFLQVSKAHIVGCSMGGTVALAFAGRYPEHVASLTAIDTTACYGEPSTQAWEERGQRALNNGFESMLGFQVSRWFSEEYAKRVPQGMKDAVRVFLSNTPQAYLESCRMLGVADERPALPNYQGPAAVVVGEHDFATPPAMAREIQSLIKNASLLVLPGLRHYTPIEAPETIADAIRSAMQRA